MKRFINATLRVKLIISFLVVSIVPLTIFTIWNRQQTRQVLLDRAQQRLLGHGEQTAMVLKQFVTQNLNSVRVHAQLPSLVKYLSAPLSERSRLQSDVEATFETLVRRDVLNIASYSLLDRQGRVVVDTRMTNLGTSSKDWDFFQKPLQTGFPALSDRIYSTEESNPLLYFSSPVRDRQGEMVGVLLLRYQATILQQIVSRSHPSELAILLNSQGIRLAQNNAPNLVLQPITALSAPELAALQQLGQVSPSLRLDNITPIPTLWENLQNRGESPFFTFKDKQTVKHAAIVSLSGPNWSLVIAQSENAFLAPIQAQLRYNLLLGLLSSAGVSLAALALGYLLTRPILALTETVGRLAAGELHTRSSISSKDELGQLAIGFNRMAEQISQLLHNLERRSQELELSQSTTVAIGELSTAIFDRDRLLQDATQLILDQFHLQTVRVYLWDNTQKCLVLQQETTHSNIVQSNHCALQMPEWVAQTAKDYQPHRNPNLIAITSVPMMFNSQLVGILELEDLQRSHFSEVEHETFKTLANQMAITWSNAELIQNIQAAKERSRQQNETLEKTLQELTETQSQLIQTEKMSSLGQLVAGVAHEINNPVSFIYGNLNYVEEYSHSLLSIFQAYQQHYPNPPETLIEILATEEIEFVMEDFPKLLRSIRIGASRIQEIVKSLRTFSRLDESDHKTVDIHEGLDSTLLILQHRLRASPDRPEIEVIKDYQSLPPVDCLPSQLNQVFMNIIANAIDALEEHYPTDKTAKIILRTKVLEDTEQVQIIIEDNGPGIPDEIKDRIFDPFFTTKQIGKGTGLGMSISYQIITEKHGGKLECISELGRFTSFLITLPTHQTTAIAK